MQKYVTAIAILVVNFSVSHAQAPPEPTPIAGGAAIGPRWSASIGYETLALRDISRTTRPVTASPVAWKGSGPAFHARVTWENRRRVHELKFDFSLADGFEYAGPTRSEPAWNGDRARYFGAHYEYRRFPFRDLALRGFDLGFGAAGLATRVSFSRRVPPDVRAEETRTNAGGGGSVVARFRRWEHWGAEAVLFNGLLIGRRGETWANGTSASGPGGGWLTALTVQTDVRITGSVRLVGHYTDFGEGFFTSHRGYALSRHRVAMGVTYGR